MVGHLSSCLVYYRPQSAKVAQKMAVLQTAPLLWSPCTQHLDMSASWVKSVVGTVDGFGGNCVCRPLPPSERSSLRQATLGLIPSTSKSDGFQFFQDAFKTDSFFVSPHPGLLFSAIEGFFGVFLQLNVFVFSPNCSRLKHLLHVHPGTVAAANHMTAAKEVTVNHMTATKEVTVNHMTATKEADHNSLQSLPYFHLEVSHSSINACVTKKHFCFKFELLGFICVGLLFTHEQKKVSLWCRQHFCHTCKPCLWCYEHCR